MKGERLTRFETQRVHRESEIQLNTMLRINAPDEKGRLSNAGTAKSAALTPTCAFEARIASSHRSELIELSHFVLASNEYEAKSNIFN